MLSRTASVACRSVIALAIAGSVPACTVEKTSPNLVGQDIRMTFIHTSDIHSRLFPYNFIPNSFDQDYGLDPNCRPFGGIARMSAIVKDIRNTSQRSLWIDSGDAFQGAPVFNEFKGEAEMRALSLAGMDGQVVGNHEFDLGAANLFDKIDNWSQFPHLASNYRFFDPINPTQRSLRDVIKPFEMYDVQGLRVAVIGMGNIDTLTSIAEGGNSLGFRGIEDREALERWVRILRPISDVVVVVSHLGLDEDEDLTPSQVDDPNAALPLEGVDVILGGHLHIVTNPPKILSNDDGSVYCKTHDCRTVLVHSGAFAKYVGRLDLVVRVGEVNADPEKRSRVVSFAYTNVPVQTNGYGPTGACDQKLAVDPDIANLMWPYSVKLNQQIDLNGVFSYVGATVQKDGQTIEGVKVLRQDPSGGDSQLGNMVARAMQQQPGVEAEFALTNSLGVRSDFERGPLTNEQMFNVFPFENSITIMYVSGIEVQAMLDFVSRRSAQRGCRTQAQVAGITFDMVCQGTCDSLDPQTGAVATACAKNIYLGDNCRANGNPDGPVDPTKCARLSPTGLYRIAVNDYIAAGGSGFDVLKRNSSKQDTGISLRDSLTVFLNKQPSSCNGVPTDQVVDEFDVPAKRTIKALYGEISCLDSLIEKHDGRIRPVFE
ncbi:MAG: bifunctional metallophosphatase/5'-nucleotidase [Deltaproteobacteria bacterium]|nr:bifunctional metallophosphatase/5'-nucleotidase [Deltaproteobacteria bacterium]